MKASEVGPGSQEFTRAIRYFFFLFLLFGSLLGGGAFLYYSYVNKEFVGDLLVRESFGVQLRKDAIESCLDDIAADLEFLVSLDRVKQFAATGDTSGLDSLAKDFFAFVKTKGIYDQVRLLDAQGREVVRINYNSGFTEIVSPELLQEKGRRYYFKDTMLLLSGEVFVSPMDLNIENGEIEIPRKPVIRFGAPLYRDGNEAVGAVIINYLADDLLGELRKIGSVTVGQTMLLNSDGYWLLAPDSKDQWGFMLPGKSKVSFAHRFPTVWSRLLNADSGQIQLADKIFTFATIHPLNRKYRSSSGTAKPFGDSEEVFKGDHYYWKLVSYVPDVQSQGYDFALLVHLFLVGAGIFLIAGGISWPIALTMSKKRIRRACNPEEASLDFLTGLSTRTAFSEVIEEAMAKADRLGRQFSLVLLVVEGLPQIVENYGRESGDQLLVQVSQRIKASIRLTDTVARLDEYRFVVMLPGSDESETVRNRVDQLRAAMSKAFPFYDGVIDVEVGIGVSSFPDDASGLNGLLEAARPVSEKENI